MSDQLFSRQNGAKTACSHSVIQFRLFDDWSLYQIVEKAVPVEKVVYVDRPVEKVGLSLFWTGICHLA